MKRFDAIKAVYGKSALTVNKTVSFNGEVFTAWAVVGFRTFEDLNAIYSLNEIEFIYDSGE